MYQIEAARFKTKRGVCAGTGWGDRMGGLDRGTVFVEIKRAKQKKKLWRQCHGSVVSVVS